MPSELGKGARRSPSGFEVDADGSVVGSIGDRGHELVERGGEAFGDRWAVDEQEVGGRGLAVGSALGGQLLVEQLAETLVDLDRSTFAH